MHGKGIGKRNSGYLPVSPHGSLIVAMLSLSPVMPRPPFSLQMSALRESSHLVKIHKEYKDLQTLFIDFSCFTFDSSPIRART